MDKQGPSLFDDEPGFRGLPRDGFGLFSLEGRRARRDAIIREIHPALAALGEDLLRHLTPRAVAPLHAHLPRLDWPKGYEPFCTWLALSRESHGYQAGPQLNVGIHADHVAARLGWDANADAFGRFEFLCRHGGLGRRLVEIAMETTLVFRVYSTAPWPKGSRCVYKSSSDLPGSLDELRRHGVWWELGRRWNLPQEIERVCSPALAVEAREIFSRLLPVYDRVVGAPH